MIELKWSHFAIADRKEIFQHIVIDSPKNAALVDERIESQVSRLAQLPNMGRPGRVAGTRELVIQRTPFIVGYTVKDNVVWILRILRGAKQWPVKIPLPE